MMKENWKLRRIGVCSEFLLLDAVKSSVTYHLFLFHSFSTWFFPLLEADEDKVGWLVLSHSNFLVNFLSSCKYMLTCDLCLFLSEWRIIYIKKVRTRWKASVQRKCTHFCKSFCLIPEYILPWNMKIFSVMNG